MPIRRAPREFSDLLTPRGLRILEDRDPSVRGALFSPDSPFVALSNAVDRRKAADLRDLIDRSLNDALSPMEDPIPEWTIAGMQHDYGELLPKTVRVRTAMLESRRARAYRIAEEIGLVAMLRSPSFHAFAQVLAGRPLRRGWGIQALCYGAGDYAGPHNDHHPEEPDARDGYIDVHLMLAMPGVAHQWLVYARGGYFSEMTNVATVGGITAYRLPFWHYTTPLVARPQPSKAARRWVLLGTFLFAPERKPKAPTSR